MFSVRKNFLHREEHHFIFQKRANTAFLNKIVVGKVVYINVELELILTSSTIVEQLKELKKALVQVFGACRAEHNKK